MARILMRFKLFPRDLDIRLPTLAENVAHRLPEGTLLASTSEEPIAFGLAALITDIEADERDGVLDAVEEVLRSVEGVSQVQFIAASRVSSKIDSR